MTSIGAIWSPIKFLVLEKCSDGTGNLYLREITSEYQYNVYILCMYYTVYIICSRYEHASAILIKLPYLGYLKSHLKLGLFLLPRVLKKNLWGCEV